jgi:hypothetical protein
MLLLAFLSGLLTGVVFTLLVLLPLVQLGLIDRDYCR